MSSNDLTNRIRKNLKRLQGFFEKEGVTAYRIYDRDIPEYPYIIDKYGHELVVYDRRKKSSIGIIPKKQ